MTVFDKTRAPRVDVILGLLHEAAFADGTRQRQAMLETAASDHDNKLGGRPAMNHAIKTLMKSTSLSACYLRPYATSDLDDCVSIWRDASLVGHPFLAPADIAADETLVRETYIPMARMTVAERDGRIVGFIAMIESFVGALFVDPRHHGHGIGRALVEAEAKRHAVLSVEVYEQNRKARAFYHACGFVEIGFRETDDQGRPHPLIGMERKAP